MISILSRALGLSIILVLVMFVKSLRLMVLKLAEVYVHCLGTPCTQATQGLFLHRRKIQIHDAYSQLVQPLSILVVVESNVCVLLPIKMK